MNVSETIRFGYYSQTAVFADDEQRVSDYVTVDDVKAMGYRGSDSSVSRRYWRNSILVVPNKPRRLECSRVANNVEYSY